MNVLDLFSGIGGFSLGLERTGGFRTVAFCEIEPFCRRVLAKHWPEVPCYDDVRTLTADRLAADGIAVDAICGGFPCQDISVAGKGAGLSGERSGLWREYARLIGELRPRYVIVENVAALLGRGLDRVLGDLASLGFDAEWHCIPASAVGAPHRRDRVWIVADTQSAERWPHAAPCRRVEGKNSVPQRQESAGRPGGRRAVMADTARNVRAEQTTGGAKWKRAGEGGQSIDVADAKHGGREGWDAQRRRPGTALPCGESVANATGGGQPVRGRPSGEIRHAVLRSGDGLWFDAWLAEPDVGRVADGVPARVDRLRSLGNAVVPQIPELIGRAILAQAAELRANDRSPTGRDTRLRGSTGAQRQQERDGEAGAPR